MGKVIILDENTANQIAAGEVVERPASIVKEMVENSLDANATSITVDILNGGKKSITIIDNGDGIDSDDVQMAFERHATSKIRSIDDLYTIATMGFRGEALASIASVSKVEVITKTLKAENGIRVKVEGGEFLYAKPTGAPKGTTFIVKELFYNTPARYKFLKRDATEAGYIHDAITRIALARPDVSMKFINQGKTTIHTPGNHDLLSTIYSLFGKEIAHSVIPLDSTAEGIKISGYAGKPEISRGNRNFEFVFVNGRWVYNKTIIAAIEDAYKTKLMQKRFPFTVLKLDIDPRLVDVNVHPAKLEVRFSDEQQVFRAVNFAVSSALSGTSLIHQVKDVGSMKEDNNSNLGPSKTELVKNKLGTSKSLSSHAEQTIIGLDIKQQQSHYTTRQIEQSMEIEQPRQIEQSMRIDQPKQIEQEKQIEQQMKIEQEKRFENISKPPHIVNYQSIANEMSKQAETDQAPSSQRENDKEKLLNSRVVGQAFESFIILELGDELFLIDQHAAHERVRYEKIKEQFTQNEFYSQGLMTPLAVELTEVEMQKYNELHDYITRLGFETEDFGNRTILIRSVPYIISGDFSSHDFRDILERLIGEVNRGVSGVSEIIPEETIYMMACKSEIKANRPMSTMEIEGLVKDLLDTTNPYNCVHGRPIIISIKKRELEKKFKRIV
jgi:DNA mismatch repair protein MutL